jgi:hypothetical protein
MEDADRVSETRMNGAWKGKLRNTKLPNAAQALKFWRVDQIPSEQINGFVLVEYDETVNWIPEPLSHRITLPMANIRDESMN